MPFFLLPALIAATPQVPTNPEVPQPSFRVSAQPRAIHVERGEHGQFLNFEFQLENPGTLPLILDRIELAVYDAKDHLVLRRFIDTNGLSPSIQTLAGRDLAPGKPLLVYNPFFQFRPEADLHRLVYTFTCSVPESEVEARAEVTVRPSVYATRTALSLPLKGRVLVHDGHDFYAHHRRFNTLDPRAVGLGLTQNFMRYAYDFCPTNAAGEAFKGKGELNEDWYGLGAPVLAPGDGRVVAMHQDQPDNVLGGANHFNPMEIKDRPMRFYGNYVVIDHGQGEFSLLGHVKQHSVTVHVGDAVKRGQPVAQIGSSGSSNNPHLHYELRTGADLNVEGLPSSFSGYKLILGSKVVEVAKGQIDSGDLVEQP